MPGPAAFRTLKQTARNLVNDPPQALRELPGRTVRVTVIGIGRALLLADRVREEYKEVRRTGVGPTVTRLRSEGVSTLRRGTEPKPAPEEAPPVATSRTTARPEPSPAPAPAPVPPPPVDATAADLPVPNYDDLSVPSLRARLRNLDADQVGQLRDYEKAHANRESVLAMYDNRIAKLRAEPPGR